MCTASTVVVLAGGLFLVVGVSVLRPGAAWECGRLLLGASLVCLFCRMVTRGGYVFV